MLILSNYRMNPVVLSSLTSSLIDMLKNKQVDISSMASIISKGMALINQFADISLKEKQKYLGAAIEIVAKGADGKFGTSDDLIPEAIAKKLVAMIENDILTDVIELATGDGITAAAVATTAGRLCGLLCAKIAVKPEGNLTGESDLTGERQQPKAI